MVDASVVAVVPSGSLQPSPLLGELRESLSKVPAAAGGRLLAVS